jgi:hypothetical protein
LGNDNTIEGDDTTAKNLILKATSADVYPIIELLGNTDIHFHKTAGRAMIFYDAATQAQKFTYAAHVSTIEGGSVAGDDIILKGNSNDAYPKILLEGDSNIKQYFKAGSAFYLYDSTVQAFKQSYAANVSTIEGGHITGDNLVLKANDTDAYPYLKLFGNDDIYIYNKSNAVTKITFSSKGFVLSRSGTTSLLQGFGDSGDILQLKANDADATPYIKETGNAGIELVVTAGSYVQFGVYSAKGAEAFDGFITIKDQAGNLRKVMTCA